MTILPPLPPETMCGTTARVQKYVPVTFTSSTRWKIAGSSSGSGTRSGPRAYAALLTRMSMRPNCSIVRLTIACTCSLSVTSTTTGSARRPSACTCLAVLSMSRHDTARSSAG